MVDAVPADVLDRLETVYCVVMTIVQQAVQEVLPVIAM